MSGTAEGADRPGTETLELDAPFLDTLDDEALFATLLGSQAKAIGAVERARPALIGATVAAAEALQEPGSRLIYCGAGTSGRVALLDGVELNPTFNWPEARLHILVAGGSASIVEAQEGAEDDGASATRALDELRLGAGDVVVGLAASGTTPFVLAALEAGNRAGALTIGVANNAGTPVLAEARCPVLLETGAEALAGSTRLAAGTSQKIALNIFSTALMVRLGKVYRGRMIDMRVTNRKLQGRAVAIVRDIVGCDEARAREALAACEFDVRQAILVARGATRAQALALLERHGGRIADADRELTQQG
ncbi:MAG: N-acetylmuramic acid 6-phosphate etherase [Roseitalea porphyridii]|uniref:N-acetylmuramic acid 6-phosphate etherase n=1 Tax=Roseitalea porphyridii TaxID=1852022 RepID=UPI0032EFE330